MDFTTTTVHLPDGNHIRYMDSGNIDGTETYTSIIMLHGSGFNSYVFERLHPLAEKHKLRLITVQRRNYRGSSPYTDAEIENLKRGDAVFLERWAILLGHLIHNLIGSLNIPEPNPERTDGGIVLLGWSIACATVMTLLSDASLYDQEEYNVLRRYLRQIIFYDPPDVAFGFPSMHGPGKTYPRLADDIAVHYQKFKDLVSSYYNHPTPEVWDGNPEKLDSRIRTERATTDDWSKEEQAKIFEIDAAIRSEWHAVAPDFQNALWDLIQRTLFDQTNASKTFPDVSLVHVVCWKSIPLAIWGYHCMRMAYKEREDNGKFARPIRFEISRSANHFWHWDSPDEFLGVLTRLVRRNEAGETQL